MVSYPTTIEFVGSDADTANSSSSQEAPAPAGDDSCCNNVQQQQTAGQKVTCERVVCSSDSTAAAAAAAADDGDSDGEGQHSSEETSIRLVVTLHDDRALSAPTMDDATAELSVSLLMDQIDHLVGGHKGDTGTVPMVVVDTIKFSNIRFDKSAVDALKTFLSMHVPTVKHLALTRVLTDEDESDDNNDNNNTNNNQEGAASTVSSICSLVRAFQSTSLDSLDLSHNTLKSRSSALWRELATHKSLKKLVLDYVDIDDASMDALNEHCCTFQQSLEDLYVVLQRSLGVIGIDAANDFVSHCMHLKYLRWVYKHGTKTSKLPWQGLRQMVVDSSSNGSSECPIVSLLMEGSRMTERDCEKGGLCDVLAGLPQLKNLKLRNLGLNDSAIGKIVDTLLQANPPLLLLDLSYNSIKTKGVQNSLSKLATSPNSNIIDSLQRLCLDRNRIDSEGFNTILETFGAHGQPELDVRLDSNPFDAGRVAFGFALAKCQADRQLEEMRLERDQLQHDLEQARRRLRQTSTNNSAFLADYNILKREKAKAVEEREVLTKAFAILGASRQMEETRNMMERLGHLEEAVFAEGGGTKLFPLPDWSPATQSMNRKVDEIMKERRQRLLVTPQSKPPINRSASGASIERTQPPQQQDSSSSFSTPVRTGSCGSGYFSSTTSAAPGHGSSSTIDTMHESQSSLVSHRSQYNNMHDPLHNNSSSQFSYDSYNPATASNRNGITQQLQEASPVATATTSMMKATNGSIRDLSFSSPTRISPRRVSTLDKVAESMHSRLATAMSSSTPRSPTKPRRYSLDGGAGMVLEACREDTEMYEDCEAVATER